MSLFHRGDTYRLDDHIEKHPREIRRYKPPRPLSWLSCVILLLFGAVLLYYGGAILVMRFAGTETQAAMNTRLVDGQVVAVELRGVTTNAEYTYTDAGGTLHGGSTSLIGNKEPLTDTISIRYLPSHPGWSMASFRTEDSMTPFGALLLGVILIAVGIGRLREIRRDGAEPEPGEKKGAAGAQ